MKWRVEWHCDELGWFVADLVDNLSDAEKSVNDTKQWAIKTMKQRIVHHSIPTEVVYE